MFYCGIDIAKRNETAYILPRLYLRRAICLAANRAAFCDPILSEYYQSLKARGKHHLTDVGAVARKLCNIIFTILRENRPYEGKPPKKDRLDCVRKATMRDLPEVVTLFKKTIHHMNDSGIYQWDDIYPDELTLKNDIKNDALHLLAIDNEIAAVFVLNRECDSEYACGNWTGDASSFAVVHRLCVNANFQHKGLGTRAMIAAETILKSGAIKSVRLDAFSENPAALRLYQKLGYLKVGSVSFRKGLFFLYEKIF